MPISPELQEGASLPAQVSPRRVFSRVGWTFFVVFLVYELGVSILAEVLTRFLPVFAASPWYTWILQAFGMYALAAPLCALSLRRLPAAPRPPRVRMDAGRFFLCLVIALGALYTTNILTQMLIAMISQLKGGSVLNPMDSLVGGDMLLAGIFFGGILAPVVEEYIFRGLLLRPLRRYGDGLAIFASGLLFALFHANLYQIFYAFVLGSIFAYIALKTGTIFYCVVYHVLINLLGLILLPALSQYGGGRAEVIVSLLVLASVLAGFLLFAFHVRDIELEAGDAPGAERAIRLFLSSPGIIAYVLICLAVTVVAAAFL